jgi:hypothetical protein
MSRLGRLQLWSATALLAAGLSVPAFAATQTFTGKVSDSMCGAKHQEGVPPADCVRACVNKGAHYALVVGDKVYTLDTSNDAQKSELDKLAWENAHVRGTLNGDTITVSSVRVAQ